MTDEIVVPGGRDVCSPGSLEFQLGLCGPGGPGQPRPPPARPPIPPPPPPPVVPGPPGPPPPRRTPPPADEEPPPDVIVTPEGPAPTDDDATVYAWLNAYSGNLAGRPAPAPRPRRPARRPKPKPKPKRRPRRSPRRAPRVPIARPLAAAARFLRGVIGRLGGGAVGVLFPTDVNTGEPGSGDPYYGGFYDQEDDTDQRFGDPLSDSAGRPNPELVPGGFLEVVASPIRPGPYIAPPLPTVAFPGLGAPSLSPWSLLGPETEAPGLRPKPRPQPKPRTRPLPTPRLINDPLPVQLPKPRPRLAPKPRVSPAPTPRLPTPRLPIASPLIPGVLTLPVPQPVPKEELDKCNCEKKKKKSERKKRDVCYRGTYTELSNGLIKRRKEKIECR